MGMTTTRDMEALEAQPHEHRCFEWNAEVIQERAAAAGVEIDGELDDTFRGMRVIDIFHMDLIEGRLECQCETQPSEAEVLLREIKRSHPAAYEAALAAVRR